MIRYSFVLSLAAATAVSSLARPVTAQIHGSPNGRAGGSASSVARAPGGASASTSRSRERAADARDARIPPGHLPPTGTCRIWRDGVPPGLQSPPTDCRTAMRNRPADARVIASDGSSYPSSMRHDAQDCRVRDRYGNVVRERDGGYRYDRDCLEHRDRDRDRHRDRDRWDDDDDRYGRDHRFGRDRPNDRDDYCLDRNHDGRCDYAAGRGNGAYPTRDYPRTLPQMVAALMMQQGIRSPEARRWLGDERLTVRYTDADRNRVPERATWFDSTGRIAQVWIDADRNGRADRVELYRNGRRVRVIQ